MPASLKLHREARRYYFLIAALSFFAWVLCLIAVFVPWSWKDTAVFERTYISLFQNCIQRTDSLLHEHTCWDNDLGAAGSVTGGSGKCRGFFMATQGLTILAACFCFLTLGIAIAIIDRLSSTATDLILTGSIAALSVLSFGCSLVAFITWIVYALEDCQPGSALFPVGEFSWGWICMVVASFLCFLAMCVAFMGIVTIQECRSSEPPIGPYTPTIPPTLCTASSYQWQLESAIAGYPDQPALKVIQYAEAAEPVAQLPSGTPPPVLVAYY